MDIETLKVRVYFLAGQLEEAKKVYTDAIGELSAANKKSADEVSTTESTSGGKVVRNGNGDVA